MSSLGPQLAPATTFPNFDQGLGRARKGLDLNRENVVLGTVHAFPLFKVASIGAGVANTTIQDYCPLPGRLKISKIVVFFSAVSDLTGCKFNIVLGTGAYTQGDVPGNDNSSVPNVPYNANGQAAPSSPTPAYPAGGGGFCTNPAVAGKAMFAADVLLSAVAFPSVTTATGTGATYGQQLVPASPDAVWPNQGILTLRAVTTASTGSISNLIVVAYASAQPLNPSFPASNFPIYATPEPTIDY